MPPAGSYEAGVTRVSCWRRSPSTSRLANSSTVASWWNARNLLDSPQTQTSGPQVERRILGSVTYSF